MTRYPIFDPSERTNPEIVVELNRGLIDGGLKAGMIEEVEASAKDQGYTIMEHAIWRDDHRGGWMVSFKLKEYSP